MSDTIIYAEQVETTPGEKIPVASQPADTTDSSIDDIYINNLESRFMNDDEYNQQKIEKCWKYGNIVRIITSVDIILCIFNGFFYNPLLFITAIIPLCGYQGAVQFCSIKTMLYLVYLYSSWFSRIIEISNLVQITNSNNSTYIYEANGITYDVMVPITFISLSCIIQLMFAVFVSAFICILYKLTPQEHIILRNRIKDHKIPEYSCC